MISYLLLLLTLLIAFQLQSSFLFSSSMTRAHKVTMSTESLKTPLVANGKRFEADPGSSMLAACNKLGLKIPLDCRKGNCGTCTISVGGSKMKACVGKVPPAPKLKSLREKGLIITVDN